MTHLLLIPSEAHRDALIGCNLTVPPIAGKLQDGQWHAWRHVTMAHACWTDWDFRHTYEASAMALVLIWSGAPVPEGCDRVARTVGMDVHGTYTAGDAETLAYTAQGLGFGSVVEVEP